MAKKKKTDLAPHRYDEKIEAAMASIVVDSEYETSRQNVKEEVTDYESAIDMLECRRTEKNYDWMSDVFIPEAPSIILTEASSWGNQYFASRDFVEAVLESDDPNGVQKCNAAKKAINKTLNIREIRHFQKYMRGRHINALASQVYAVEWWDQEVKQKHVGFRQEKAPLDVDIFGKPFTGEMGQEQAHHVVDVPVYKDDIVTDHYNYEVIDPANVFPSSEYAYDVQDKQYVFIRAERTKQQLKDEEDEMGYINLRLIDEQVKNQQETETSRSSYNKDSNKAKASKTPFKPFDVVTRFGKFHAKVTQRGEDDYPLEAEPGIDDNGEPLEGAEFIECVIAYAMVGNSKILIRFQPQKNRNPKGKAYRPLLRGSCYLHPRKDSGLSSAKYLGEMQTATNDFYNLASDRTKLSTLPTLMGRKSAMEDNTTVYFEPEHVIEVDDVMADLKEIKISDNINGALEQMAMLRGMMQQVESVYPSTMGMLPDKASTTATAVAGAESRTNLRSNYKALTYEYTFLIDQYTHILWMTHQYAKPETMLKMMGDDAYFFDPDADYTFSPITSNIEMEHSKQKKLQILEQIIGRIVGMKHPDAIKIINYALGRMFSLLGDEFSAFQKFLPDTSKPIDDGKGGGGGGQPKDMKPEATSNQNGTPQSSGEQDVRGAFAGAR